MHYGLDIEQFRTIKREQFKYLHISHETWVMYVVLEGAFACTLRNKKEIARTGNLYFIPPNETVDRSVLEAIKVYHIGFSLPENSPLEGMLPIGLFKVQDQTRLNANIQTLRFFSHSPSCADIDLKEHFVADLVYSAIFEAIRQRDKTLFENDNQLGDIVDYLQNNYMHPMTLKEVASVFGLSPSGLIFKFKKDIGILPMRYLLTIRMNKAKRLLTDTSLPIHEIATLVGYSDQYYFSRAFKKEENLSPSAFRKQNTI